MLSSAETGLFMNATASATAHAATAVSHERMANAIREPTPEAAAVDPDVLIVPLAAFDRAGHRICFGAGYYDMTIRALRAKKKITAVGIAFAAQEIPRVPATERDERLDLVLTEREIIDLRR